MICTSNQELYFHGNHDEDYVDKFGVERSLTSITNLNFRTGILTRTKWVAFFERANFQHRAFQYLMECFRIRMRKKQNETLSASTNLAPRFSDIASIEGSK